MAVIDQETQHRRPHPQSLSGPFLECDLIREVDQLHREPEWESGQNARTLVKYDDLRIVVTALKPRKKVPGHQANGRVSIQGITGHVLVRADGRTFDVTPGRIVTLDRGIVHELEAIEESAVLLTIARPSMT